MSEYEPTPKQSQAIREYLHESIVPLIEQVLVKKLGQAMSYAAEQLIQPKREWVDLTDDEMLMIYGQQHEGKKYSLGRMVQAKLKEKNT